MDTAGARRAVWILFWAVAALTTVSIVGALAQQQVMNELKATGADGFEALLERIKLVQNLRSVLGYLAYAGLVAGALSLGARAGGAGGRLARWAGIGFAIALALSIGSRIVFELAKGELLTYARVSSIALMAARTGALAALWLGLSRIVRDGGQRVAIWLPSFLVGSLVLDAAPTLLDIADVRISWYWPYGDLAIDLFVGSVTLATLAAAARALAAIADGGAALPVARVIGGAPVLAGGDWSRGAEGLGAYAAALSVRLVVLGAFYALLLLAFIGKSMTLVNLVGKMMPVADFGTALFLMAGVLRFAAVPIETGGRGLAHAAFLLMLAALLLGLYGYVQQLRLLSAAEAMQAGRSYGGNLSDLMDTAERLPWIALIGIVLGLFAQLMLLLGFGAVADHLGVARLVRSIHATAVGLILVSVGVVALYWYVLTDRHAPAGIVLPLAFVVVASAFALLIRYVGLVRWLQAAVTSALAAGPRSDSLIGA